MKNLYECGYLYGVREQFAYPNHKVVTREAPDGSQYLSAFGIGRHTNDPYNPVLEVLLYEWDEFLARTRDHKRRGVIVEGFKRQVPLECLKPKINYAELVRRGGENLFVTGLAVEGNLTVFSAER